MTTAWHVLGQAGRRSAACSGGVEAGGARRSGEKHGVVFAKRSELRSRSTGPGRRQVGLTPRRASRPTVRSNARCMLSAALRLERKRVRFSERAEKLEGFSAEAVRRLSTCQRPESGGACDAAARPRSRTVSPEQASIVSKKRLIWKDRRSF